MRGEPPQAGDNRLDGQPSIRKMRPRRLPTSTKRIAKSRRKAQRESRRERFSTPHIYNQTIDSLYMMNLPYNYDSQNYFTPDDVVTNAVGEMEKKIFDSSSSHAARMRRALRARGGSDFTLHYQSDDIYHAEPEGAIPLIADLVSLPGPDGPKPVPFLPLLPENLVERYATPSPLLFRSQEEQDALPETGNPRIGGTRDEYIKLVRRMYFAGLLVFHTEAHTVNGVFAVPKPDGTQRVIIHAQPANRVFAAPPKIAMPSVDVLASLRVPDGVTVHMANCDIDNYFHRLLMPEFMQKHFALPPVRAGDLGLDLGFEADQVLYPCAATLPMGFSHSAFIAQAVHEHVVATRTSLGREAAILPGCDTALDRLRYALYLDDGTFLGVDGPEALDAVLDEYMAAMISVGLPPKMKKVEYARVRGTTLGLEFDGERHTLTLEPHKMLCLITDTEALVRRGKCSGRDLGRLIGRWTWAVLCRRPALAALRSVYGFVERQTEVAQLWPSVIRELRTLVGLAPLLVAELGAAWHDEAVATDASMLFQGVTVASVTEDVATEVAREAAARCRREKGRERQMERVCAHLSDVEREMLRGPRQRLRSASQFIRDARWRTVVSAPFRWPGAINWLEMRAAYTGLRWFLSTRRAIGKRLLLYTDNTTVEGALRKGRSSAHQLLSRQRPVSALLLASGCRLSAIWVPSGENPADAPSRPWLS